MNRALLPVALLVVAAALVWALWPAAPVPARAGTAAPTSAAPASQLAPLPPLAPASAELPPVPKRVAVVTATEPPPAAVLNPAIPLDRAGARRLIAQEAPPAPGIGDPTNADTPPPEPGVIRKEAVREAVLEAKPAIAGCYEQSLKRNPTLGGTLKVQFTLRAEAGKAHLKDAEITEDSLGDPFLGMCALKAIAEVEFEAEGDGEVVVNYPFILQPEPAQEGEGP